MSYSNEMVVSLKIGDKFLRENNGEIKMPFLSEYSIYIKNLKNRNALVNVFVDGKDVLNGNRLIVYANSILELEGFMDNNIVRNKFRFIQRTEQIENFLGINPEDGLIHVQFDYEKEKKSNHYWGKYIPYRPIVISDWTWYPYAYDFTVRDNFNSPQITWTSSQGSLSGKGSSSAMPSYNTNTMAMNISQDFNDNGITVKGEDTYQPFGIGYVSELENSPSNIVLKLKGFSGDENKKMFTKDKLICTTCGTASKLDKKFCQNCGTRLEN